MKPGDVFWITDVVNGRQIKHLHVVLTHPEPDANGDLAVAVVSISTVRSVRYDKTTVLKKTDHDVFVEQQYYVAYRYANFEKVVDITNRSGYASSSKPLKSSILGKVMDGLFAQNGLTPGDIREYCSKRVGPNPGQVLDLSKPKP